MRSSDLCFNSPPGDSGTCKCLRATILLNPIFFFHLRQGVTSYSREVLWGLLDSLFSNPFSLHMKACSIVLLMTILIYLPGERAGLDDPLGFFSN